MGRCAWVAYSAAPFYVRDLSKRVSVMVLNQFPVDSQVWLLPDNFNVSI